MAIPNLYWPVYKNLEKEFLKLSTMIYKYIEKKVPVVTTTKDSTCEAKLDDIENIFKSF